MNGARNHPSALLKRPDRIGRPSCLENPRRAEYSPNGEPLSPFHAEPTQNLSGRKLAMLVLSTINWDYIKAGVERILMALGNVKPGSYAEIEIPE
jgi:hypothetical protein